MRTFAKLSLVTLGLAGSVACGWFAGSSDSAIYIDPTTGEAVEGGDADAVKCRPKELDARGAPPYAVGDTTPSGWTVTAVDADHVEYVRVAFDKAGTATELEFAHNADGPGDWSTDKYKLMPAPEATPPEELLQDAIARLREHAASESGPPFVKRSEGVQDPYEGLPPCP